jgi:hypothetical protein|tara:strand:+ start:918 stop:1109 length:192 start_codon:yes stop_codon:yes gene_type:complete
MLSGLPRVIVVCFVPVALYDCQMIAQVALLGSLPIDTRLPYHCLSTPHPGLLENPYRTKRMGY